MDSQSETTSGNEIKNEPENWMEWIENMNKQPKQKKNRVLVKTESKYQSDINAERKSELESESQ